MRTCRQIMHMGAVGRYKFVCRMHIGQCKFIGRICTYELWANPSSLEDFAHGHSGPTQAFQQDACGGTMGQYRLVSRMLALVQWANTSFSAEYVHEHHGPIQAFWQKTHMSAMGQCE